MDESRRWIIGLVVALALVGLLLLARGEPDGGRGDPTGPASTSMVGIGVIA